MLGPQAIRNGADVWLRNLLNWIGFGQYFLLPVLIVSILLAWHHTTCQPWKVTRPTLYGMAAECAIFAVMLRILLQLQVKFLSGLLPPSNCAVMQVSGVCRNLIGFMGAGIYEELLFRLILVSVIGWLACRFGATKWLGITLAIVISSLMFAAAHYIGPYGEQWYWFSFLFRFLAGTFFGVLFVVRGFGIAAGTHAVYDILVGLM